MKCFDDRLRHACALLVLVTISASAACPQSSFNFFPNGTRNEPGGWRRANQTTAGNGCDGHLLPIATYGYPKPLLHFAPQHSLLVAGGPVSSEYAAGYSLLKLALQHAVDNTSSSSSTAGISSSQRTAIPSSNNKSGSRGRNNKRAVNQKAATSSRPPAGELSSIDSLSTAAIASDISSSSTTGAATFLGFDNSRWGVVTPAVHEAAATFNDSSWHVVTPAVYNITVTANGRLWYKAGPYNVSNGDIPAVDFEANAMLGRKDLFDPSVFREGINSVAITITLLQDTGVITDGTTHLPAPFAHENFDSPPIDFYFSMSNSSHDSRPTADVTVSSCAADVKIKFQNTTPGPTLLDGYRLTHTSSNTSQALFLPTYYVYGSFVQGLDGSTGLDTDNTDGNVKTFGVYVTRLPGSPDEFSVTSNQLNSLKEGWYMYTVEGSIWSPNSNFNNLVSVAGTDVYSQKDATYISVQADGSSTNTMSLYAGFKGAGWVLPEYNQSRVGIQRYQTWLQAFEGPKSPLTLGSKATFNWDFSGLGNTSCEINGVNTNPATGICTSPLVYTIATTLNQTLVLKHTDVCAVTHTANMTFGGFGWEVSGGVVNELGSYGTVASGTADMSLRKSSKARRLSGGLRAVLFAAVLAFFLMVLLL